MQRAEEELQVWTGELGARGSALALGKAGGGSGRRRRAATETHALGGVSGSGCGAIDGFGAGEVVSQWREKWIVTGVEGK